MKKSNKKNGKKNTWQYKRILEILDDYWIENEDTLEIHVEIQATHKNGSIMCDKHIHWFDESRLVPGNSFKNTEEILDAVRTLNEINDDE